MKGGDFYDKYLKDISVEEPDGNVVRLDQLLLTKDQTRIGDVLRRAIFGVLDEDPGSLESHGETIFSDNPTIQQSNNPTIQQFKRR